MDGKTNFNGRIDFEVHIGRKVYKLGFKAEIPAYRPAFFQMVEESIIYFPWIKTAVNPRATRKGWEEAFNVTYIGNEMIVKIKKPIKCVGVCFDPNYTTSPRSQKRYRRLYFNCYEESYVVGDIALKGMHQSISSLVFF